MLDSKSQTEREHVEPNARGGRALFTSFQERTVSVLSEPPTDGRVTVHQEFEALSFCSPSRLLLLCVRAEFPL